MNDKKKERLRLYRLKNKDKRREYEKKWRIKNRERYLSRHRKNSKKYREAHKSLRAFAESKRRAKKRSLIHDFSPDNLLKLKNETFGVCPTCFKYVGISKMTLDHILPISKAPKGFIYTTKEVRFICFFCNSGIGNKQSCGQTKLTNF